LTALPCKSTAEGILLFLRVTPRAGTDRIAGLWQDADGKMSLQVKVRTQPEKGKANEAVIALLAESFGLPRSALSVMSGGTSRLKTIRIDAPPRKIEQTLRSLIERTTA
jgi:uncharacterized protein (TIGR00251 family)